MTFLIGLGVILFFIMTLILPWKHRAAIAQLREDLDALRRVVAGGGVALTDMETPGVVPPAALQRPAVQSPFVSPPAPAICTPAPIPSPPPAATISTPTLEQRARQRLQFEQQFFAKLPVWIGGVALAFAGFYLVKYSIDHGILTPGVRTLIGLIFGTALIAGGQLVHRRPGMANGMRIGQALCGAGIADLYGCIFAATSLYGLIPPFAGGSGMALVTALAVFLSLRHGAPIALMGLTGGLITPALISSNQPNAMLLFAYIYLVFGGIMAVVRLRQWWWMAPLALAGAYGWVLVWVLFQGMPDDTAWLGLFLLAATATTHWAIGNRRDETVALFRSPIGFTRLISLGAAVPLMVTVAHMGAFDALSLSLFAALSAACLFLAWRQPAAYYFAPWLSLGASVLILLLEDGMEPAVRAWWCVAFAALHAIPAYWLHRRHSANFWTPLFAVATVAYFLAAYARLVRADIMPVTHGWGALALTLALLLGLEARRIYTTVSEYERRNPQLGVLVAGAAALFTMAVAIEASLHIVIAALSIEISLLAWLAQRLGVPSLRTVSGISYGGLLIVIAPSVFEITGYAIDALFDGARIESWRFARFSHYWHDLGIPALMLALASVYARNTADDRLVRWMEYGAILLGIMALYIALSAWIPVWWPSQEPVDFTLTALISLLFLAAGACCLWVGARWERKAVHACGKSITAMAMARSILFGCILAHPLFATHYVGMAPIVNSLLIAYLLPALWAAGLHWMLLRHMPHSALPSWTHLLPYYAALFGFAWISLSVRHWFHPGYLDAGITEDIEIYSYSAVWLLTGGILLAAGTLRHHRGLRYASLGLMLLTVGKVFLYDAAELTGLYRVFSFLGLGFCLIALSYVYSRFVAPSRDASPSPFAG